MRREKSLREFEYDVEKDFEVDGTPASWAGTDQEPAHRYWGDEHHKIELPYQDDHQGRLATSALTPDKKFIAASNGFVVSVVDIATKQCRMEFRGLIMPVRILLFSPRLTKTGEYTLMISSSESDRPTSGLLEIDKILEQSLNPIISQLKDLCGYQAASPFLDTIRAEYRKTLDKLQSALEARDLRQLSGIRSLCASPVSSNGKLLLYRFANQHAKADPPQPEDSTIFVAVHDLERDTRLHVLGDQLANIIWTGLSPDDKSIVTVARGIVRIYDTMSGECKQEVSLPDGRYRGTWAPDSKHILLYGMMREINKKKQTVSQSAYMAVYSTETGDQIAQYTHETLSRRPDPIVTAWSPSNEIAIASETHIWIWRPFEDVTATSLSVKIENPLMRMFAHFIDLIWVDEGRLLIAKNSSGTIEAWDKDKNVKWRFQRPRGPGLMRNASDCYWLEETRTLVSLDMDASLRFYNL